MQDLISLTEASKIVPRRPTVSTLWRWARKGLRARDGQLIRLEHRRIGARVYTTASWLSDFFARCTAADQAYFAAADAGVSAPGLKSTPALRRRQFTAAVAELDEAGL